jgi:hypothetical protein
LPFVRFRQTAELGLKLARPLLERSCQKQPFR